MTPRTLEASRPASSHNKGGVSVSSSYNPNTENVRGTSSGHNTVKDRRYYLNQVYSFYEKHLEGPIKLPDVMQEVHHQLKLKENSQKNKFEDLQNQVS